jgi:glutathione S-transferase
LRFAKTDQEVDAAKKTIATKFKRLETVRDDEGPFFAGPRFSFVDTVFAPAFRQLDVLEGIASIGVANGFPKVSAWKQALAARPSVKAAVPANYVDLLLEQIKDHNGLFSRLAA